MKFEPASKVIVQRLGQLPDVHYDDCAYAVGHSTVNVRQKDGEVIHPLQTITNIIVQY